MAKQGFGGLGKGLDNIFLDNEIEEGGEAPSLVRISSVEPRADQPRKYFDRELLQQLADSILQHGVLQPIILRPLDASGDRYQIVAGERRWRASQMAGLNEIPAIIMEGDELEAAEIALVENIQRENLNAIEEAQAYYALREEFGLTQEEVSAKVGKSRAAVANALRLLDLPDEVLALVREGNLSAGHARALLSLKDEDVMISFAERTVVKDLSVRELENEVRRYLKPKPVKEEADSEEVRVDYVAELERRMRSHLGREVKLTKVGGKKSLVLYFEDNDDLQELLRRICGDDFIQEV